VNLTLGSLYPIFRSALEMDSHIRFMDIVLLFTTFQSIIYLSAYLTKVINIYIYIYIDHFRDIYIYIYICVCLCVCLYVCV
jgi:hypothetical protein